MTFGQWVKHLRAAQDWTQERLAEELSCAVQTVRAFESGARRPSRELAQQLAAVLKVPPDQRTHFVELARQQPNAAISPPAPAASERTQRPRFHPPRSLTPMIGRSRELAALCRLITDAGARLVTLMGPGGMGKTRLATQVSEDLADHFEQGALFIGLAPVTTAAMIPGQIAAGMGVALDGALGAETQVVELLAGHKLLLVLDNFEQLLAPEHADDALALIETLLLHCPGVQVLVTSRERLRVHGEQVFELGGLAGPPASRQPDTLVTALADNDAAILFLERARQVDRQFALNSINAAAVAQICELLQGSPLGLELAAFWVRMLPPHEIAAEIARGIDFLALSDRSLPARHRSMRAVFDHSWKLLAPEEREVLMRLAVFRDGFERTAARQVAALTLPQLAVLVDKSLVGTLPLLEGQQRTVQRYDLHDLLRQYLAEQLRQAGEERAVCQRHAQFFTQLAEEGAPQLLDGDTAHWVAVFVVEQGNLRAALDWCLDQQGDPRMGLQLAGALGRFWYITDQWREGSDWLGKALAAAADTDMATAQALSRRGEILQGLSENAAAAACFDAAINLWRRLDQPSALAWTLFQAGSLASEMGDGAQLEAYFEESLVLYRALGNRLRVAMVLNHYGGAATTLGNYARAQELLAECLPVFREYNRQGSTVMALNLLGRAALGLGEIARAQEHFAQALVLTNQERGTAGVAWTLLNQGLAFTLQQDYDLARTKFLAALEVYLKLQRQSGVLAALDGLASVFAAAGQVSWAVQLLTVCDRERSLLHLRLSVQEEELRAATLTRTRAASTTSAWEEARRQGQNLSLGQAVELASQKP